MSPHPRRPQPSRKSDRKPERRSDKKPDRKPEHSRPLREDLVTQASLEAYGLVRHEGRLADRALDFTLRHKRNLYSSERRAVAERVYALLRRQLTVDHLLASCARGFERLTTSRKDLLRLCASRVLHGERPEAVARSAMLGPADAGALEALPKALRALQALPEAERFPIVASLPPFLAERFRAEFGAEAEAAAEAMNERAPLTARVNSLKGDRDQLMQALRQEGVECRPTPLSPLGVLLDTRINAFSLKTFKDGGFELQDEGSQLLGMLVAPPRTRVVDACAGAGGKTLQLAAQMENRGEIFALDVDERRMEELKRRTRRAGVHNVRTQVIPPAGEAARIALRHLEGKADRVLVDAPCSGSGTFRRKPDARYRLTPDDLAHHVERQKALLEQFAHLVKPGGRLIYGTCSMLREENEAVVESFLAGHPDFSLRDVRQDLGGALGDKVTRGSYLRLSPHRHGTDGFFGAVLTRNRPS